MENKMKCILLSLKKKKKKRHLKKILKAESQTKLTF